MYLVFTRMPADSYRRRLRYLLLCLCDVFQALINPTVLTPLCVDSRRCRKHRLHVQTANFVPLNGFLSASEREEEKVFVFCFFVSIVICFFLSGRPGRCLLRFKMPSPIPCFSSVVSFFLSRWSGRCYGC